MLNGSRWYSVRDGDARGLALYLRHYSARRFRHGARSAAPGHASRFCGPGEHMVLVTSGGDALWVWRKQRYRQNREVGIECFIFRNEGAIRSSDLIREADGLAWSRWPGARLYTYVDPTAVRSTNPGFCFLAAGWSRTATVTSRGFILLEHLPKGAAHAEEAPS